MQRILVCLYQCANYLACLSSNAYTCPENVENLTPKMEAISMWPPKGTSFRKTRHITCRLSKSVYWCIRFANPRI